MKYGKMMKGIGVAALALTVVSSCIVGGTLAKYTTTVTGQGSAIVAKWAPKFTKDGGDFTGSTVVKLSDTTATGQNKVIADRIAPGTQGSFAFEIAKGDTEVAFEYSVEISDLSDNWPEQLKFYTDAECKTEAELVQNAAGKNVYQVIKPTQILTNSSSTGDSGTIYWKWAFEETGAPESIAARDALDSSLGAKENENDRTMTFKISCIATQIQTTQTP